MISLTLSQLQALTSLAISHARDCMQSIALLAALRELTVEYSEATHTMPLHDRLALPHQLVIVLDGS